MNPAKTEGIRLEIPVSKIKVALLLFIALIFVAEGVSFIVNPTTFTDVGFKRYPKFEILIVGYACVIFFGTGVLIFIFKLFDNKPGLLIDDQGITINPSSFSNSFIKWSDIEKFGILNISRTKLILIYLKNPEDFINSQTNSLKRKVASFSFKRYGTPLSITTGSLKSTTNELYKELTKRLNG